MLESHHERQRPTEQVKGKAKDKCPNDEVQDPLNNLGWFDQAADDSL